MPQQIKATKQLKLLQDLEGGGVNLVKGRIPFSPEDEKCDAKHHRFGHTVESGPARKKNPVSNMEYINDELVSDEVLFNI